MGNGPITDQDTPRRDVPLGRLYNYAKELIVIYPFQTTPIPDLVEVGGKGLSLIKMTQAGFPVPLGFVCGVTFFAPWLTHLQNTPEWTAVQTAIHNNEDLHLNTIALKAVCANLTFAKEQAQQFKTVLQSLPTDTLFAVRSSSPEEDLEGASFAGGYKTSLGVTKEMMLDAVRASFASAFDERVFVYKQQQGFAVDNPRIAIVVQQQIVSETAGVGFSLNPLNNDYDEAVIDANWGLGESVVAGMVTPDHFVVDKVSKAIVERVLGGKETAVSLTPTGGIQEQANPNPGEFCLTDGQVIAITDMLIQIETLYDKPADIEWAFADDILYLLQARPVTAFVPLPPEMLSAPGARRTLYWDVGLSDGITINKPLSPLASDWLFGSFGMFAEPFVGKVKLSGAGKPTESLWFARGGRIYVNVSQLLTMTSAKRIAKSFQKSEMDVLLGELLANIDEQRYRAEHKIPALRWRRLLSYLLRTLWHSRRVTWETLSALWKPASFYREYEQVIAKTVRDLNELAETELSLREYIAQLDADLTPIMRDYVLPILMLYFVYFWRFDKLLQTTPESDKELVDSTKMGFSGNEAVDIGIQLYRMCHMLPPEAFADLNQLAQRLTQRDLPAEFLDAWDGFIANYGFRGPGELELANGRYRDDLKLGLEQMSYMVDSDFDPEAMQQQRITEREQAYKQLRQQFSGRKLKKLDRTYKMVDLLGGSRDTSKFLWVLDNGAVRSRALQEGEKFVVQDRLNTIEDIFWFTLDEIDAANTDPAFDLRQVRDEKQPLYRQLNQVIAFPHIIDSRGRIGQVEMPAGDPHVLTGLGISRGIVRGRIKVLHTPREKPVGKGDVLVAYTTDPGWTPLFVNAEAIILEVGGMLQHGGVVAREYGKPCVAGIQGITTTLQDGQLVEVDGTTGVVRILVE